MLFDYGKRSMSQIDNAAIHKTKRFEEPICRELESTLEERTVHGQGLVRLLGVGQLEVDHR